MPLSLSPFTFWRAPRATRRSIRDGSWVVPHTGNIKASPEIGRSRRQGPDPRINGRRSDARSGERRAPSHGCGITVGPSRRPRACGLPAAGLGLPPSVVGPDTGRAMSQENVENVEIVRAIHEATARHDRESLDAILAEHLAPDFEFEALLTGLTYMGASGTRELVDDISVARIRVLRSRQGAAARVRLARQHAVPHRHLQERVRPQRRPAGGGSALRGREDPRCCRTAGYRACLAVPLAARGDRRSRRAGRRARDSGPNRPASRLVRPGQRHREQPRSAPG